MNTINTILTLPQNSVVITDAIKFVQQSKEKLMSKKKVIENLKRLTVMKMVNQKKTR